jgi:hypothetical protein
VTVMQADGQWSGNRAVRVCRWPWVKCRTIQYVPYQVALDARTCLHVRSDLGIGSGVVSDGSLQAG